MGTSWKNGTPTSNTSKTKAEDVTEIRTAINNIENNHVASTANPHGVQHSQTNPEQVDPTSTATTRSKHVSNNDIKVLVDHANNIALHSASASGIGGEAILTELKKVDGLGSGLDSDLLDGMESSAFVQKSIVTAANDFIVGTGASAIAKKTLAETKVILNVPDDTDVIPYGGLTTGIPNSFVVTTSKAITLTAGRAVCAKMHAASSGPCVLNWNGAGAKSVKKPNGNDPNLKANGVYTFRYDGTNFILQGEGGEGTAQKAHVLTGYTFTNDDDTYSGTMPNRGAVIMTPGATDQAILDGYHNGSGKVSAVMFDRTKVLTGTTIAGTSGTMPNRGAVTITPGTADQIITDGYHNGSGRVVGDPDLIPQNIVQNKNVFGVTGSFDKIYTAGDYLRPEQLGLLPMQPVINTGADRDIYRAVSVPGDLDHVYVCDVNETFVAKVDIHTMQYDWQVALTASDICTDGSYIYVVGGVYLTKFDLSGNQIWQITGPMNAQFYGFNHMDYCPGDGLIHTTDTHRDYRRYDLNGNMIGTAVAITSDTAYKVIYVKCSRTTHRVYIFIHNTSSYYALKFVEDGVIVNSLSTMYLYPEAIVPIDSGNVLVAGTSGITLYDASMDKISSVNTTSGQSLGSKALVDITDGTIYYVYHKSTDNILHLCKIDSGVTRIVTDYDYTALAVSGDSIIRFVHNGVAITDGLHSYKLKFKILSI